VKGMIRMKYLIMGFQIPYWYKKRLSIDLYWREKELKLTVWFLHKIDLEQYEDEWFSNEWKHFVLYRRK